MLTKIIINNEAYEVNLLQANEVIDQIKSDFIGPMTTKELQQTQKLNEVIAQYIDYYEKVNYHGTDYFILKSNVPIEYKQKTHKKKFMPGDEIGLRMVCSIALPLSFILSNIVDALCNFKNMVASSIGSTKIKEHLSDTEISLLCMLSLALNIAFWVAFEKSTLPFWSMFIVQAFNLVLGILKPIQYHYNQIENYKLSAYTFDSKYENISADPLEKLHSMKTTQDKKKIDFDFTKEDEQTEKEKNYATY